jgi:hypothetical protein
MEINSKQTYIFSKECHIFWKILHTMNEFGVRFISKYGHFSFEIFYCEILHVLNF